MSPKVSIVIEKDDYGYYAYCPELEGCQSQGDTLEEVMANIKEAIELVKETWVGECAGNPRGGSKGRLRN
ncbi:MAG: type II toxin-antitoxin system HicB family antitoxin [Desulfobaccales bacterium]